MESLRVLQLPRLPARLTVEQAGALLGFHPDAVYFLAKKGLLKPLGAGTDVQLVFATVCIRRLWRDERWLANATNAVRAHHRVKNAAQKSRRLDASRGITNGSKPHENQS